MKKTILLPSYLERIPDYVPGEPIESVAARYGLAPSRVRKHASNESVLGPSPRVLQAVRRALPRIHLYPESHNRTLAARLGAFHGVRENQVVFGNGSDELLDFAMRLFTERDCQVLVPYPTFQMYSLLCKAHRVREQRVPLRGWKIDLDDLLARITADTRLIFLCNPNNPTGDYIAQRRVAEFLSRVPPRVCVVLDEAYADYAQGHDPRAVSALLRRHPATVFTYTFSKLHGMAGLRLGYGLAAPEAARAMQKIRPPFNANLLAQTAASAAMEDGEFQRKAVAAVLRGRQYLYRALDGLGCPYIRTEANFICVRCGQAAQADEAFAREGLIIRPLASFGMPEHIRYTIGLPHHNRRFIQILEKFLKTPRRPGRGV